MTKHGLSETQAWNLLNTMQDQTSLEELLNALRNKDSDKTKQELLRELEAPAYRVRIERLQDLLRQVDTVMQEVYQHLIPVFFRTFAKIHIIIQSIVSKNGRDTDLAFQISARSRLARYFP